MKTLAEVTIRISVLRRHLWPHRGHVFVFNLLLKQGSNKYSSVVTDPHHCQTFHVFVVGLTHVTQISMRTHTEQNRNKSSEGEIVPECFPSCVIVYTLMYIITLQLFSDAVCSIPHESESFFPDEARGTNGPPTWPCPQTAASWVNGRIHAQYSKSALVLKRERGHLYAGCHITNIINLGNKTSRLYRCWSCLSAALNEFVVLPTLSFRHSRDMNEVSDSSITLFVQDNTRIPWFI